MLAIPRPTTRAECLQEARPCPWVGCRHHLLLEVAAPTKDCRTTSGAPGLMLAQGTTGGRRRHLPSSCAAELVRMWMDDALELLQRLPYSCSLDRADDEHRGRASLAELSTLMGVSKVEVKRWRKAAMQALVEGIKANEASGT